MAQPRRDFLKFVGAAGSLAISGAMASAQGKHKFPDPPAPAEQGGDANAPLSDSQTAQHAQLQLNEKEFRQSLASLFDRVNELKQDTDAMHTSQIFSVKVFKQTAEIEHLAKKLRSLVKT
jgi:hypothetical protein